MAWSIFRDGGGQQVAVGWAEQLLKMIGAPRSAGNVQFIYDWEVSEGGGGKYNPLNQGPVPGQPNLTTTGSQYGGGAADFASWQAGLMGAADYLNMPNYRGVRDALRSNDPVRARAALIASPWAASHYGGGSAFSNATVPGGKPVLPPSDGLPSGASGASGATLDSASAGGGPGCLLSIGGGHLGLLFGHGPSLPSACLVTKPEARAVLGAILIASGGLVLGLGAVIMAAYGLKSSGAGRAAGRGLEAAGTAAAVIPGAQPAAAGLRAAGGKVRKAGSARPARGRTVRRAVPAAAPAGREPPGPAGTLPATA